MHQLQPCRHCYERLIESATAVSGSAGTLDGLLCQLVLKLHTSEQDHLSSVHTAKKMAL